MATIKRRGASCSSDGALTLLLSSAMRVRRRPAILLLVPLVVIGSYVALHDYVRASAFVVKAAGMQGVARTAAEWEAGEVTESHRRIPWRSGLLAARGYSPARRSGRCSYWSPVCTRRGVEEPRLVGFARDLASHGPRCRDRRPARPGAIRDHASDNGRHRGRGALAVGATGARARRARSGMMGISFAGGLSIVAAGRPSIRDKAAAILSLGGHGDLARTLRYLCTGRLPDGSLRPPHDYGVVIILLSVADRVVPADQVGPAPRVGPHVPRGLAARPGRQVALAGNVREGRARSNPRCPNQRGR